MNQSHVTLLNLPNEILLIIFNKLNNMGVLYSLLDVDNDDVLSIADSIINRFCIDILPKIDYNVKSLILELGSMERVLFAADYPNLTELKLYNVNDHIVSHHFTASTAWLSLYLNKLCVHVCSFEDCFALLDGRLKQLTTFIVHIDSTDDDDLSTIYNMHDLPNMKCFSLTCRCPTDEYDTQVLLLLHRMIKLEELTLDIINDERSSLIDGTQINDKILVYMPCLRKFTFHISTDVELHH